MVINQGDIYWMELDEPVGAEPGYKHPHVIVQNNLFNRSQNRLQCFASIHRDVTKQNQCSRFRTA